MSCLCLKILWDTPLDSCKILIFIKGLHLFKSWVTFISFSHLSRKWVDYIKANKFWLCCSVAQFVLLLETPALLASLSFISWSLLKLMSAELVMPPKHLIFCYPFFLLSYIFPSIRVFSNESSLCIRWPNYWSFSFSISPSSVYSGLISLRIDWFDPLVVQGTLKSLLQILPKMCIIPGCVNLPSATNINILFSWSLKSHSYFPYDSRFTSHLTSIDICGYMSIGLEEIWKKD